MNFKSPEKHRTALYRARAAYYLMKKRCGNANGLEPAYTGVELRMSMEPWLEWAVPEYEKFLLEHPVESPNVSRRGDTGHYEIGNIEIISAKENRKRQAAPYQLQSNGLKKCSKCKQDKPPNNYSINRDHADGLNHYCKVCNRALATQWRRNRKQSKDP